MKKLSFFTKGNYYLVPNEFNNFNEFVDFLNNKLSKSKKYTNIYKKLNETKCLAPYFVEEYITQEKLTITSTKNLYKAEIETMPFKEYNKKLGEVVKNNCKDCLKFIDDGDYENLNGHHEEITLDSLCVFKIPKVDEHYYFYFGLEDFISTFKEKQKSIERLIDKKDYETASNAISFYLSKIMETPINVVVNKHFGKYYCYLPSFFEDVSSNVYHYLCYRLNKAIKNFKFMPYIPKGAINNYHLQKPKIYFEINEKGFLSSININSDNMDMDKAYLSICNTFGENRFLTAYMNIVINVNKTHIGKEFSYNFIEKDIKRLLKIYPKDEITVPCIDKIYKEDVNHQIERTAVLRSNIFYLASNDLKNVFSKENEKLTHLIKDYGISIAVVNIKKNLNLLSKDEIKDFEEVFKNNYVSTFANEYTKNETNVYLFVYSVADFLNTLRKYSPMFSDCNSTLNLLTLNQITTYNIDFKLTKISNTKTTKATR